MKKTVFLLLLCSFGTLPMISIVYAQKQDAVDPGIYSAVQRKLTVDELLQGRDLETLSEEELDNIYTASLEAGSIPAIGRMKSQAGNSYVFETGLAGLSQGSVPKGLYRISIKPIDDIAFILSGKTFLPRSPLQNELAIGMREEKGKGEIIDVSDTLSRKIDAISLQKNSRIVLNRISGLFEYVKTSIINAITKFTQKGKNAPTQYPNPLSQSSDQMLPVTIKLFTDTNSNGTIDPKEALVPWANVQITLTKISQEKELTLKSGDNALRFDQVPANAKTAYELLSEVLSSGVSEATVSGTQKKMQLVASVKNTSFVGDNFPIKPRTSYNIIVPKEVTIILIEEMNTTD